MNSYGDGQYQERADFTGGWARRYDAATAARVDDEGSRGRRGDGPPEDGGLGCRGFGPVAKKNERRRDRGPFVGGDD